MNEWCPALFMDRRCCHATAALLGGVRVIYTRVHAAHVIDYY